jgi:ABC-type branched-subunit amino acid transport system substrate-binding protein
MRLRRAAFALVSTVLLIVGGCSSKSDVSTNTPGSDGVRLYGEDSNTDNSLGEAIKPPTTINGMVGTTPLTPLSADFRQRLKATDPTLSSYTYAGEAYDAAMISALAVQLARTTDPVTVAKYVNGVTVLAPGGVECMTIKDCLDGIASGRDIAYRGVTVHSGFTDAGEPSTTSYGTLHFGRDNRIDDGKTEFVSAGNSADASKLPSPPPGTASTKYKGDPLKFGILLPKTGGLAWSGPAMFAGAHLAISEINGLGGILGKPVGYVDADDGTDPVKSGQAFDKLVQDGVGIFIGPSSSRASLALIPKAVAANRILFATSATSAALTKADDHGLFFRTAPSDLYQSQALADVIMRGGARKVFIIARDDSYGTGLRDGVTADLVMAGIKKADVESRTYPPDLNSPDPKFDEIAQAVTGFHPDAVLVAGFAESAHVIEAMEKAGLTLAQ